MASRKRSVSNDADMRALYKEWDEASCPICMDHPHNAVLLLCSSYDNGCRSYICDTSYRHSNCLDRFRKLRDENSDSNTPPGLTSNQQNMVSTSSWNLGLRASGGPSLAQEDANVVDVSSVVTEQHSGGVGENYVYAADNHVEVEENIEVRDSEPLREIVGAEENIMENLQESKSSLRCPLCRGSVLGWKVVEEARRYLNSKPRSCSHESCSFFGNYRDLRRHARRVHPAARPADVDPSRQQAWRHLEDQREYNDIVSAIRTAMPGAVVLGDYVIENGERLPGERERGPGENSRWLSTFFLFQMIDSMDPVAELRGGRSRALSRHRRSTGALSRRRFLWGENLLGLQDEEADDDEENEPELDELSDVGEDVSLYPRRPRRRRRLTRSREDGDQQ